MKPDSSDPEPEGLTLLVPDIQKTAEIVYAATTSLRQANQGAFTLQQLNSDPLRVGRNDGLNLLSGLDNPGFFFVF